MSNEFDTRVYLREKQTPWARVDLIKFMRDVVMNGTGVDDKVVFTLASRPNVTSGIWYDLEWTGADTERHSTSAQTLDKLLWRAAEVESMLRERVAKHEKEAQSDG